jgi:glyoxylase-like metal-dependent hydrolase (beta-lactamase superfamily II)
MKRNERVLRLALAIIAALLAGKPFCAYPAAAHSAQSAPDHKKVELLHVQGSVYMIAGAGANITVQVGNRYVMVVDSGVPQLSEEVLAAIRSITDKHILFIINTSADEDHTGGNGNLSKAGWALPNASINPLDNGAHSDLTLAPGASILAHSNVLNRMSAPTGKSSPTPSQLWPTDIYDTDDWRFYNGEEVYIYHAPNAHTDGDSYVLFRRSGVVSTGDIFTLASYPVIRSGQGGSIDGIIAALNQIIELLVPEENEEGGTYVIPGHGRICDRNDVVNYRDMVTIIRGQVQAMLDEGMTIEQVKAARPTLEFDGLYGAASGPWTTDMFVDAVYRELSGKNKQQKAGAGR